MMKTKQATIISTGKLQSTTQTSYYFRLALAILCGVSFHASQAQIETVPIKRTEHNERAPLSNARLQPIEPLSLPFWDDFSTPSGIFPDSMLWEHSNSVWVNNTMAIGQPTINTATFDGLDSTGLAYDPENILVNGYTDKLTSRAIDLSDPAINRTNTYLSFFYQWQGNGEAPDITDFLELQFKDDENNWKTMLNIYPEIDFERRVFYDTAIRIDSNYFFHSDFQFRFRSFGRESGPYDTWNLDYVYLNDNRDPNDDSYPERAAASEISSPFGEYTAMPHWHFNHETYKDTVVTFAIKNMSDLLDPVTGAPYPAVIAYALFGTIKNYLQNGTVVTVKDSLVSKKSFEMAPYERREMSSSDLFAKAEENNYFNADADSVDINIKGIVLSDDEEDRDKDKLAPIDLTVNDTVSTDYYLRNYYAYDDGVAEYAAGLIVAGTRIAYQFEEIYDNPSTEKNDPDTLLGFDIYFPPYSVTSNQTLNFYVMQDDPVNPGELKDLVTIIKGIEKRGLNEFQKIRFIPALLISGKFYIGWEQPAAGKALVGLDIDNDTGHKIYTTSDNKNWYLNDVVTGSLMVRPVFGPGNVEGKTVAVGEEIIFEIYPNPAKESFYIQGRFDDLHIYSATGASVSYERETEGERSLIKIAHSKGLHLVTLTRNNRVACYKILLTR